MLISTQGTVDSDTAEDWDEELHDADVDILGLLTLKAGGDKEFSVRSPIEFGCAASGRSP